MPESIPPILWGVAAWGFGFLVGQALERRKASASNFEERVKECEKAAEAFADLVVKHQSGRVQSLVDSSYEITAASARFQGTLIVLKRRLCDEASEGELRKWGYDFRNGVFGDRLRQVDGDPADPNCAEAIITYLGVFKAKMDELRHRAGSWWWVLPHR